jgi:hypothetical protein
MIFCKQAAPESKYNKHNIIYNKYLIYLDQLLALDYRIII